MGEKEPDVPTDPLVGLIHMATVGISVLQYQNFLLSWIPKE